ncbi:hypothetical protein GOEFS_086_00510 [Gordonia effusa NBRC 100432]|uniref:Uncharacterized protein n=1 Tax=Gordonia effusa NBRC 100432 TaxID=1077974 RepID=H0R330_9ACTN|nr:hypothetical protein [Gordonia effusa]GAB19481.1 hypothetical protein GOEFS_086_00510 [Gordonia effusa NBRC 100432]
MDLRMPRYDTPTRTVRGRLLNPATLISRTRTIGLRGGYIGLVPATIELSEVSGALA